MWYGALTWFKRAGYSTDDLVSAPQVYWFWTDRWKLQHHWCTEASKTWDYMAVSDSIVHIFPFLKGLVVFSLCCVTSLKLNNTFRMPNMHPRKQWEKLVLRKSENSYVKSEKNQLVVIIEVPSLVFSLVLLYFLTKWQIIDYLITCHTRIVSPVFIIYTIFH